MNGHEEPRSVGPEAASAPTGSTGRDVSHEGAGAGFAVELAGRRTPPVTGGALATALLYAAYALSALGLGRLAFERPDPVVTWAQILLFIAGTATFALRRRPRLAFAAVLVLTTVSFAWGSGAEAVLVLGALYAAGSRLSTRAGWAALGILLGVGIAWALILGRRLSQGPLLWGEFGPSPFREPLTDTLNCYFFIAIPALIAALIGIVVGQRRRLIASLVERAEQLRRERDQQASIATSRERERIAREMHDVIAHSLSVMIAVADGARATAVRKPEESREAIGRVAETGRRTLDEVRRLLGSVRGDDEESLLAEPRPQPDLGQLPALVDEFRAAGLPVRTEISGALPADPVMELTIYRIVQESLTNALRHGRGVRDVLVRLDLSADRAGILIEDAAETARRDGDPGRGLVGIRERVAFYDGTVETGPRPEGGWRVRASLPVRSEDRG